MKGPLLDIALRLVTWSNLQSGKWQLIVMLFVHLLRAVGRATHTVVARDGQKLDAAVNKIKLAVCLSLFQYRMV